MDKFKPSIPLNERVDDKILIDATKANGNLDYLVGPVTASDLISLNGIDDWNYEFVDEVTQNSFKMTDITYELEATENGEIFVLVHVGAAGPLQEED